MAKKKLSVTQRIALSSPGLANPNGTNTPSPFSASPFTPSQTTFQKPAPTTSMQSPAVPMTPSMLTSIKSSRRGVIPPGLARYLAAKRKAKGG